MKLITIILFGLITASCSTLGQENHKELKDFNDFLGIEKATAMNAAVESFELFLETNFADLENQEARTKAFLRHVQNNFEPDSSWIFSSKRNKGIIHDFEISGLRKEIWVYGHEEYEPKYDIYDLLTPAELDTTLYNDLVELDLDLIEEEIIPLSIMDSAEVATRKKEMEEKNRNSLHFNTHGQFLYALAKYTSSDSLMQGYVDMKAYAGNILPVIIASGLLHQEIDFNDPFIKRILVTEFYFWLIRWDIERKGKE